MVVVGQGGRATYQWRCHEGPSDTPTQHPKPGPGVRCSDQTSDAPPFMQQLRLIIGGSYGRLMWWDSKNMIADDQHIRCFFKISDNRGSFAIAIYKWTWPYWHAHIFSESQYFSSKSSASYAYIWELHNPCMNSLITSQVHAPELYQYCPLITILYMI